MCARRGRLDKIATAPAEIALVCRAYAGHAGAGQDPAAFLEKHDLGLDELDHLDDD